MSKSLVKLPPINNRSPGPGVSQSRNQSLNRTLDNDDDGYIHQDFSAIKQNLYQKKIFRKKVENEQQALMNRINRLKMQEEIIEKKIFQTHKKALNIYNLKQNAQQKKQEMKMKLIEVDEIPFTHPQGQLHMLKCQAAVEENQNKKRVAAENLKQQLAKEHMDVQRENSLRKENLSYQVTLIQKNEQQVPMLVQLIQEEKRRKIAEEAKTQLNLEEQLIKQKAERIRALEQYQNSLLQQLSNTQIKKQNASETLLASMKLQPAQFQQKFQTIEDGEKQPNKKRSTNQSMGHL